MKRFKSSCPKPTSERWVPVLEYEGIYEVSNLGRIRSIDRITQHPVSGKVRLKGRMKKFSTDRDGYNVVSLCKKGRERQWRVARVVLGSFKGLSRTKEVDHKDRNVANDALRNLRPATSSQNKHNQTKRRYNTSGYKGVSRNAASGPNKWMASIGYRNKIIRGYSTTKIGAARLYDKMARKYHKKRAVLNFP